MDLFFVLCFFAGFLSFLSPCVLPIVPSYLCFLTGVSITDLTGDENDNLKKKLITRSIFFVMGFSLIFILMGASVNIFRPILNYSFHFFWISVDLQMLAGAIIIIFGLHLIGLFKFNLLYRQFSFNLKFKNRTNLIAFVLGLAFAFGWTPCIGPILATILTLASSEQTIVRGTLLLFFYSMGLGVPFILSSFAINSLINIIKKFNQRYVYVEVSMGVMMLITGLAFIMGWIEDGAFYLLDNFTILSTFGI